MNESTFAYQDPAVAWVYATGWQWVAIGSPLPPMVIPIRNSVREMNARDGVVTVYEDALGDFGRGSCFPVVGLDLKTGEATSRDDRKVRPSDIEAGMQTCKAGEVVQVTEARYFHWVQDESLRLYIGRTKSAEDAIKVWERNGFGMVSGWLYVAEQNCLLVAAFGQRPLSLWDADHYVIRIDLAPVAARRSSVALGRKSGHLSDNSRAVASGR